MRLIGRYLLLVLRTSTAAGGSVNVVVKHPLKAW